MGLLDPLAFLAIVFGAVQGVFAHWLVCNGLGVPVSAMIISVAITLLIQRNAGTKINIELKRSDTTSNLDSQNNDDEDSPVSFDEDILPAKNEGSSADEDFKHVEMEAKASFNKSNENDGVESVNENIDSKEEDVSIDEPASETTSRVLEEVFSNIPPPPPIPVPPPLPPLNSPYRRASKFKPVPVDLVRDDDGATVPVLPAEQIEKILDKDALLKEFGVVTGTPSRRDSGFDEPRQVTNNPPLLDDRKLYTLDLISKQLGLDSNSLHEAIMQMDISKITYHAAVELRRILPESISSKLPNETSSTEKIAFSILSVPHHHERLKMMELLLSVPEEISDLLREVNILTDSAEEILSSKDDIFYILSFAGSVVAYMNESSLENIQFGLNDLLKLENVQSNVKSEVKKSLLDFIIDQVRNTHPECLSSIKLWSKVRDTRQVDVEDFFSQVTSMNAKIVELASLQKMLPDITHIHSCYNNINTEFQELVTKYEFFQLTANKLSTTFGPSEGSSLQVSLSQLFDNFMMIINKVKH